MVNRNDRKFAQLREAGRAGFITYIAAGDPSPAATEELVLALEAAGVDIRKLGVPFSDPLADGAVNQMAAQRARSAMNWSRNRRRGLVESGAHGASWIAGQARPEPVHVRTQNRRKAF